MCTGFKKNSKSCSGSSKLIFMEIISKTIEKIKSVDLSKETLGNIKCLECLNCKKSYSLKELRDDLGTTITNVCYKSCLGPLSIKFALEKIKISSEELLKRPKTFSILNELLPFESRNTKNDFAFSELRYSKYYSNKTGFQVYLKLDMNLPSGSFKDRPVLASLKRALETGYKRIFVASTGNLAISCLQLGKALGFEVRVYLSNTLNKNRREYIEQFADNPNKQIVTVNGSYDDANIIAIQDSEKQNKKDLEETGLYKTFVPNYSFRPYYKEGSKTSGYEIALQLLENKIPEDKNVHIFYPLGSGALICSAYKGIHELSSLGIFKNKTSFYGIQQESLNPIVQAFKTSRKLIPQKATTHLIKEIAIGNPGSFSETVNILKESGGSADDVSDRESLESFIELYKNEKLFPQISGAMTIRGFEKLSLKHNFKAGDIVVINLTGSGKGKVEDDLLTYSKELGIGKEILEIVKENK